VTALDDIEMANELAHDILGRSLDDLPPQTRKFLELLYQMVIETCQQLVIDQSDYRFSRRSICQYAGSSLTQVRVHLERLIEHEYIVIHKGNRGQSFVYELIYNGEAETKDSFLTGLIDVNKLKNKKYDGKVAAKSEELAGSKRPLNGPKTGGWRSEKNVQNIPVDEAFIPVPEKISQNAYIMAEKNSQNAVIGEPSLAAK